MSIIGDKLAWMKQTRSASSLSRETGIPTRILNSIERGTFTPTSEQLGSLNRVYGKESYFRLTSAGVPKRQAQSLRGGSLDRVRNTEKEAFWIVEQFTRGALMKELSIDILRMPETKKWNSIYMGMYDRIVEGLSESYKTIDEVWREKKS